jgi:uncharacterized protein
MTDYSSHEQRLILPIGTHIVIRAPIKDAHGKVQLPRGAVGMITAAPTGDEIRYRIRFPDDTEAMLRRQEFSVRKHVRQEGLQPAEAVANEDLHQFIIYRCVVGSQAFGLADADSDVDRRGVYLAPATLQWSLTGAPEQLENDVTQETYWELQKFLIMALKANPNVLECLYTPLVEYASPLAQELIGIRSIFLSRFIYQTYNGYVLSQFKKMEQDIRTKGEPRWKHAMHLIRLLLSGITILREGFVLVDVDQYRERLLAIKRNQLPWDEINAWRLQLHRTFDQAYMESKLPDVPNFERANDFLVYARRSMVK